MSREGRCCYETVFAEPTTRSNVGVRSKIDRVKKAKGWLANEHGALEPVTQRASNSVESSEVLNCSHRLAGVGYNAGKKNYLFCCCAIILALFGVAVK